MLHMVDVAFESLTETRKCNHSDGFSKVRHSRGPVCFHYMQGGSKHRK